jgi:CRP/FNR family transcriptional regulator, cyclic AMP receptor protein
MATDRDVAGALGATDLFSSLNQRALKRVADTAKVVQHQAGKQITEEGGAGVGFHLILDGQATVTVHGKERKPLSAGDYFGEISLIDGKPRSATVTAESDLTTASIVSWQFQPLLREEPEVASALLLVMCERLRAAEESA